MHPAYSVIFFTTATGAGYGLLALFGLAAGFGLLPADFGFALAGTAMAYVLIVAGLLSSTFHLGHPERAWRALSQWRSSWLSREGVLAIAAFGPTGLFAYGWVMLSETGGVYALAGLLGAVVCGLTVYATSMIYASLRTVRAWTDGWVTPVDRRGGDSAPESATGLGHLGAVRLLDPPHTGTNFLMTEMGYRVAQTHAAKLRRMAFVTGIAVPFVLTVTAMSATGIVPAIAAILAALSAAIGVLIERWLFFAEAKHVVMLYYGGSG